MYSFRIETSNPVVINTLHSFIKLENSVGAKTLNDKKSEWPRSRNSKSLKVKCRKSIITKDFTVLNKNLTTRRCRKEFKWRTNIRMVKIPKGEITN